MCFEIYLPSIDKSFDVDIDGNTGTGDAICRITEMLRDEEGISLSGDVEKLMFGNIDERNILNRDFTLVENGVKRGMKLILV